MTDDSTHPAVERINRDAGFDLVGLLADELSGTDSTSLLLEVMRRRSVGISSADVLRRYTRDRFVRPAVVDVRRVLDLERLAIDVLGEVFTPVRAVAARPLRHTSCARGRVSASSGLDHQVDRSGG